MMGKSLSIIGLSVGLLLFLLVLPCAAQDDSFQRGYQQGYQAENPNSITPLAPLPGLPALGQGPYEEGIKEGAEQGLKDQDQDYESGYDQGQQDSEDNSTDEESGGDDN